MQKNKWTIGIIFLLLLGWAGLVWADSKTATATVRVTVPPKIQISLPEDSEVSLSQWLSENKKEQHLNISQEKKGETIIYTVTEKV